MNNFHMLVKGVCS